MIRFVIPILLGLVGLGVGLYYTPGAIALDREVLRRWLGPFAGAVLVLCGLLFLIARTQQSSRARLVINRAMTVVAVAIITTSIYLKGALTSYDVLYYPVLVILDRLRENRSLAIFTFGTSMLGFGLAVIASHTGVLPYGPLYPGRISPELIADRGHVAILLMVMSGITLLSFLLVDLLAGRVQRREAELREVGLSLAGRVSEQVELLRRSADLRRYLPPALADAILRGEAQGPKEHQRRRLTIVRVDCPAIAGSADETDPEEFAHLLNELYAQIGDRAAEHGGVVDRFGAGGASVLFGALDEGSSEDHAQAAAAFARSANAAVAGLGLACRSAGIEIAPLGRAAIHQGYATVGSFGSPTRLEFAAVGPVTDAVAVVLSAAAPGQILCTQPIELALRGRYGLSAFGEPLALPGARHAVRIYALE